MEKRNKDIIKNLLQYAFYRVIDLEENIAQFECKVKAIRIQLEQVQQALKNTERKRSTKKDNEVKGE